jgi:CubicO group peptidase (beta-lactamase class C family)
MTKQFTATSVMMLAEQGKIDLDKPVAAYLPDFPKAWSAVTIRHLLTHSAGLRDYTKVAGIKEKMRRPATPDEVLRLVAQAPLEFTPGEKWVYSNTNYTILGMVIEKVSGESYGDFLAAHIFKPLGMTSTCLNEGKPPAEMAQGYEKWGKPAAMEVKGWAYSDGGILSTIDDPSKWLIALDTKPLVKPETLQQMWTRAKLNSGTTAGYGFGWLVFGPKLVEHAGGTFAFRAYETILPQEHVLAAVLCNQKHGYSRLYARGVAAVFSPAIKDAWIKDEETVHKKAHPIP